MYFYCWFISYNIHVTDLILNAISFGLLLLWSALAVKCETSHLSHFSQNESLLLGYIFHKMQNAVLISVKTHKRESLRNRSYDKSLSFGFSFCM